MLAATILCLKPPRAVNMPPNRDITAQGFTIATHHDTYPEIETSNHQGRTVLITGASKGIGRATALAFARSGAATIIVAARSNLDGLETELCSIRNKGSSAPIVIPISLDVTSEDGVDAAVDYVKRRVSSVDILINNAGHLESSRPIGDADRNRQDWWKTWEVNVKGTYLVTQAFLPLVLNSASKIVINVASKGGLYSRPGASAYGCSKTAVIRFTEFLDAEYKAQGLLAYAIHPGSVATELALGMPQHAHSVLVDTPQLAADTMAWLSQERREWLGGRYVSSNWDMAELVSREHEIVEGDKLKVRLLI